MWLSYMYLCPVLLQLQDVTSQVSQAASILQSGGAASDTTQEFLDILCKVWLSEAETLCHELDKTLDPLVAEEACG